MTCQEFSTTVHVGVSATPFVLNNKSYTSNETDQVENFIHRVKREYNSEWDYASKIIVLRSYTGQGKYFLRRNRRKIRPFWVDWIEDNDNERWRLIVANMDAIDSLRMLKRLPEWKGRVKENGEIFGRQSEVPRSKPSRSRLQNI